jgi:hypothetical protein
MTIKPISPYESALAYSQFVSSQGANSPSTQSTEASSTARPTATQLSGISRRYLKETGHTGIKITKWSYHEADSSDETSVHRVNFISRQKTGVLQVAFSMKSNTVNIQEL